MNRLIVGITLFANFASAATITITKDVRFVAGVPEVTFQHLTASALTVIDARDGGRIIAALGSRQPGDPRDVFIRRTDSGGSVLWETNLGETNTPIFAYKIAETRTGEIAVLRLAEPGHALTYGLGSRLLLLSSAGQIIQENSPAGFGLLSQLIPVQGGFILAGKAGGPWPNQALWQVLFRRLSLDLEIEWEKRTDSTTYRREDGEIGIVDLKQTHEGGFISATTTGYIIKSRADGSNEWARGFGNRCDNYPCYQQPVSVYPLRDGGYAILYSSAYDATSSQNRSAPNYGMTDYWIVRINAGGQQLWDRSFGGNLADEALFLTETEDGGFIVGGNSQSSAPSGNKSVEGMGTWCLKLDSAGVKEAEILLPGYYWSLFQESSGYSAVGWGTNCCSNLSSVGLNALRRASVVARAVDDRPYNLDVSSDLADWTRVVTGFSGELKLLETFGQEKKFYRVWEP
jgi:hypothetical protein